MEEKKKIKSIMNDIIKGIKFALVFGLNIGFIIGVIKGVSLAYLNGYLQESLYNLALNTMQFSLNSTVSVSVILAIAALIALMIIKIYRENALVLISFLMILLYIASFRRISPFNYLLFILILYGVVYPISISVRLREKFSFINKAVKGKLILVPIILILICNGFIYSYRSINRSNSPSNSPNIILISIDSLRADHLSCYGYHRNTSPNIDQLASQGILFKNAFSQATWTLPSHTSIFLSQYVWRHKVDNDNKRLGNSFTTLAEILRDRNYTTCAFVGGGFVSAIYGFNQGFEIYDDVRRRRGRYEISSYIDKLLSWLESVRNRKFFLFIHTYNVHGLHHPPSPYFDLYKKGRCEGKHLRTSGGIVPKKLDASERTPEEIDYMTAGYDGGINYIDDQLGKFFRKLDQLDIDDNTIIIITSDHGEGFKEHGRRGHGHKPYIELVHVPLIMRGPGIPRNRIYENYVEHIDIVPTILEILNIPQRKETQGKSLLPLIKNFEIQEYPKTYSWGRARKKPQIRFSMSLRTKEWTYIMNPGGLDELYNRINDPKEQNNIIEKKPLIAKKLKKELEDFIALTSEGKPQVAEEVDIDEELKEQLKSLGYLH